MSAALAVVAVPNSLPVWFRQQGMALTPMRLPVVSGSELESERESICRNPGRGDAVTGQYACGAPDLAAYLPAATGFSRNDGAVAALYFSRQALSTTNGQFLNYYA